jgi:hypothetical protein
MPEFTCKICCYETSRKLNLDRHLESKKHKDNLIEEAKNVNLLEGAKEEKTELEILKKKIELLELELKSKDEKLQKQQEIIMDVDTGIGNSTEKYFNSLQNVYNFDDFRVEFPSYMETYRTKYEDNIKYLFNFKGYQKCKGNSVHNNIIETFRSVLQKIPKKERPFYVSDVKRKRIYVYNNNQWNLLHKEEMPSFFINLFKYINHHIWCCIYMLEKCLNKLPIEEKKKFEHYDNKTNRIDPLYQGFDNQLASYCSFDSIHKVAKQLELIVMHYCSKDHEYDDTIPEDSPNDIRKPEPEEKEAISDDE